MRMQSIFALACITAVAACDASTDPQVAGLNGPGGAGGVTIPVEPLVISPAAVQLPLGTSIQLSTNARSDRQTQVQWASLNTTIATVTQTGLVKAVGSGVTTIVARYSFDTTNVATATVIAGSAIPIGAVTPGSTSP